MGLDRCHGGMHDPRLGLASPRVVWGLRTQAAREYGAVVAAPATCNRTLGFRLFGIDPSHPYVESRGISLATARLFGIGYYSGRGFLSGRVVIPIHNQAGNLIAYAGRSVDGAPPKYKLPLAFRKSVELFNLHRAVHRRCRGVVVVEGFFDCMKVFFWLETAGRFLRLKALCNPTWT